MSRKKDRPIWFLHAVMVTQDRRRSVLWDHHFKVEEGRIQEISASRPSPARLRKEGARVVQLGGRWVLPGFVQPHVHLCQTLFRNRADDLELLDWLSKKIWPMEAAHTPESLYLSAILGIHELAASGTTCVLDMGTVRYTDAICEAVVDTGIRASVAKCLMDRTDTCDPRLVEDTRAALAEAETLFAEWQGAGEGRLSISYAPRFVVSCSEPLLRRLAALSAEQGARIHSHSSENRAEVEWVRRLTGRENVEYFHQLGLMGERLVLAHCIWLNETEKRILADTGTHVVHCPSSNLKLASGIAPIPELLSRGVSVGLAADGAPCNNNLNAFQEMRLAALIHKPGAGPRALRAQEVFDLATLGGARVLGFESEIGSLEPGKWADFVVYDPGEPSQWTGGLADSNDPRRREALVSSLVYSGSASQVESTWVQGQEIYHRKSGLHGFRKLGGYPRLPILLEKAYQQCAAGLVESRAVSAEEIES